MRTIVIILVILALLAAAGTAAYQPAMQYWQMQNAPKWRTAEVSEGTIVSVVNSTGSVKPVEQVSVGSFVSGPIDAEYQLLDRDGNLLLDKNDNPLTMAEFNQLVRQGDEMAKIDERIYKANVDRDQAALDTRLAEVERIQALHDQAFDEYNRAIALQRENKSFIAAAEIVRLNSNKRSLIAQLKLAEAAVKQAEYQLAQSKANLEYTKIRAPKDGIVINRKVDPGQTLAAQFQTPELFVIGVDMHEKMHVHASVDEADIGLINAAKLKKLPVTFTVDAYPDDLFLGVVEEIRLSSTTTQNVVTYPVVVMAPNPDLKLLPGMTASISFEVDRRENVLRIPNSALRFFPQLQHVQEKDKPLVEGKQFDDELNQPQETSLSAQERATARRRRTRRHVWVQDGFKLRAIEVQTGIADGQYTELVSGDVKKGDKLVIGIQAPASPWGG